MYDIGTSINDTSNVVAWTYISYMYKKPKAMQQAEWGGHTTSFSLRAYIYLGSEQGRSKNIVQ
jgi:hypothetical protein